MFCLGKSSITSCTAYGPSLLLFVALNDSVQEGEMLKTEGGVQGLHSESDVIPFLHLTSSPSGSKANRLIFLGQFEGILRAGRMVVTGEVLIWLVSDRKLSSTLVTALQDTMLFMIPVIQFPPANTS